MKSIILIITFLASAFSFIQARAQFVCGTSTVTDVDGNVYNTVQIGSRCWLKENMRAIHYANGQPVGIIEPQANAVIPLVCQPGLLRLSVMHRQAETTSVNIYDLSGRLVYHTQLSCSPGSNVIQCTLGPAGVYFTEVISGESKVTFKAIGDDHSETGAMIHSNVLETGLKSDSIILTATSRYVFDYNHDPALGQQFGKLYTPMSAFNTDDYSGLIQGICPTGWHVPTDAEWIELEISCGMSPSQAQSIFSRGNIARSLMIAGPEWSLSLGTDDFGFSAKGSGWYGQYINWIPSFVNLTGECKWFTYEPDHGLMCRMLNDLDLGVYRLETFPEAAASIRCIKDL